MQRSNHDQHQQQQQQQQQVPLESDSIHATHSITEAIPPLNALDTHRYRELSRMRVGDAENRRYHIELEPKLNQEYQVFVTRIQEFAARQSKPNAKCVEHFRKVLAREGDYSWTERKVQQYIREYAKYLMEQDSNAVPPPLLSPELCQATWHHAMRVRHDRHDVSIPMTMIDSLRRVYEMQAHREFHPVIAASIATTTTNPNYVRILPPIEQEEYLSEFHAWQQYLEDQARMSLEPRRTQPRPRDQTSRSGAQAQAQARTRARTRIVSPLPHHRHADQLAGHPPKRSGSESLDGRASAAVARAARGRKRHEQEGSPVASPRARAGHDEMES